MSIIYKKPWYWERSDPTDKRSGGDLAAIRRGLGKPAGSVPELWRFYRVEIPDSIAARGWITPELRAEHAALTLFACHQQSQRQSMHKSGVWPGKSFQRLKNNAKTSSEAIDRRVNSAATTIIMDDLVIHLRGIITLLRGIPQPLDYNRLVEDLYNWQFPENQVRARIRWSADYYGGRKDEAIDQSSVQQTP